MEQQNLCRKCDWFFGEQGCCHAFGRSRCKNSTNGCDYWRDRSDWRHATLKKKSDGYTILIQQKQENL
jgi:hypothetical protein